MLNHAGHAVECGACSQEVLRLQDVPLELVGRSFGPCLHRLYVEGAGNGVHKELDLIRCELNRWVLDLAQVDALEASRESSHKIFAPCHLK